MEDENPAPIPYMPPPEHCDGECPFTVPEIGYFLAILEGADEDFIEEAQSLIAGHYGSDAYDLTSGLRNAVLSGTQLDGAAQWVVKIVAKSDDAKQNTDADRLHDVGYHLLVAYHRVSYIPFEKFHISYATVSDGTYLALIRLSASSDVFDLKPSLLLFKLSLLYITLIFY